MHIKDSNVCFAQKSEYCTLSIIHVERYFCYIHIFLQIPNHMN